MKKQIAIVLAIFIGIISFQNCAETESVLPGGGMVYVEKITRIDKVSHGDDELKVEVDLNTNGYSVLQHGEIVREGQVPSELRVQLDDILTDPEICQLVPTPGTACTMQYRPPTKMLDGKNKEIVVDWNKCQSHKVLCNGRTSELRSLLGDIQIYKSEL